MPLPGNRRRGQHHQKPEKTAAFMDSDSETQEYLVDPSDDEYTGPWEEVVKKNKKVINDDADKVLPQIRNGFHWRVPSWPQPA